MKENHNIEWKESWRDEFLCWICGFANADGGALHIGRNDKGIVVGVANAFFRVGEIEAWGRCAADHGGVPGGGSTAVRSKWNGL